MTQDALYWETDKHMNTDMCQHHDMSLHNTRFTFPDYNSFIGVGVVYTVHDCHFIIPLANMQAEPFANFTTMEQQKLIDNVGSKCTTIILNK